MAGGDEGKKPAKGGTMSVDVAGMDLDGDGGFGGPGSRRRRPGEGRSPSGAGGRSRWEEEDADDDRRSRSRGGARGGGDVAGYGRGEHKGTLAVDVGRLDLDDDAPANRRRARPGGSGGGWTAGRDDDFGAGVDRPGRGGSRGGRGAGPADLDQDDEGGAGPSTWPLRPVDDPALVAGGGGPGGPAIGDATRAAPAVDEQGDAGARSARLTISTPEGGREIRTFGGDVVRVGRETDNDVVILDPKASRHHFELHRRGSSFELRDLDSGNGTLVNGHRVKRVTLTAGGVVRVGETELLFDLVSGPRRDAPGGVAGAGPPATSEAARGFPADGGATPEADGGALPFPPGLLIAFGALVVTGLLFGALLAAYLLWTPGAGKGAGGPKADAAAAAVPAPAEPSADALVAPALARADAAFSAGDWLTARRHVAAVLSLHPGHGGAREFLGRIDRALQTEDSAALRVAFEPDRPRRGEPLVIRVRLEQPPRALKATFMGQPLAFEPSPAVPREYVARLDLPKRVRPGEMQLSLEVTDLQDDRFELARRVVVK